MTDAVIELLTEATPEAAQQISQLLPQLTPRAAGINVDRLARVLETPGELFVARMNGVIVGMVQRVDVMHLVRAKSWIEDFVVDEAARGQGVATRLLQEAIDGAPAEIASINLTSSVTREDSHRVYAKLGFKRRVGTTIWRLPLR
ncbi:MAG: hypothetical protein NVSMB39_2860 [Candidatus Saccharimonadales bacterium]